MNSFIYSTDKNIDAEENPLYHEIYNTYDFKEVFDSYMVWGPTKLEIHCVATTCDDMIVTDMYYVENEMVKVPKNQKDIILESFKLTK